MIAIARLLSVLTLLLLTGVASAQQKILTPEKIERATVVDDKGLTQWAEWAAPECPNCTGKGKVKCTTCERFPEDVTVCLDCGRKAEHEATCRMCAGTGKLADPLDKVACPGCLGAAFLVCVTCGGAGGMKVDGAKNATDCPACRGVGGFPCGVCHGDRLVEVAALKPSLKDGKPKDLQKALAATEAALKLLGEFEPVGGDKARKEMKALVKVYETAQSVYPPLKRLGKPAEDYLGKIYAGRSFQGSAEKEAQAMKLLEGAAENYLKHQKRMLELVQKRAEANAKIAEEPKK